MASPFIAEIRLFAGNFAIRNWALCEGQLLSISQNQSLYSLLGTTYGGDGRTTFALPDLRGRVAIQPGHGPGLTNRSLGQKSGSSFETMTMSTMPAHHHTIPVSSDDADSDEPAGRVLANKDENAYNQSPDGDYGSTTTNSGGGQSFTNVQPVMGLNYIIALAGLFPPRN